jgi:hypothetical protein
MTLLINQTDQTLFVFPFGKHGYTYLYHDIIFFLVLTIVLTSTFVVYRVMKEAIASRVSNIEKPTQQGSVISMVIAFSGVYRYPSPPPNPDFVNAAAVNPPVNVPVVPPVVPNVAAPIPASLPAPVPNPGIPGDEMLLLAVALISGLCFG